MRNTDSMEWVSASARLRLTLLAWTGASVILALAAPTGASLLAQFLAMLGIVFAYERLGRTPWRLPVPGNGPPLQRNMHTEPGTQEEAQHFIDREFAAAQRGRKLALIMFGFPDFQQFRSELGSAAADRAVVEFGRMLQRMTRKMNVSARYGWRADSFLSVLSDADRAAAEAVVARVRRGAAELTVPLPAIAVGIAVYQPTMISPEQLVAEAERALAAASAEFEPR